jgi:hypothetical protein
MVEHPGMWDEARALFQVGTVVGVLRKWPKPVGCGVSTRFGDAWVSASIIGRRLTIEQEEETRQKVLADLNCGEGACSRSGA